MADRHHGGRAEVRDHRGDRVVIRNNNNVRTWNRSNDRGRRDRVVRVERQRPVYRNGGFYFGTRFHRYNRPVINYHYRNYYQRPALIVENMDPVDGYIWVQGNWSWNGYEWIWQPGHYEVDPSYNATIGFNFGY
jgi:hypothetical protein